jgi:hypothetical protein
MWTEITRPKYEREGQRYGSDLTDAALIGPVTELGEGVMQVWATLDAVGKQVAQPGK